jgi:hypothetical protein
MCVTPSPCHSPFRLQQEVDLNQRSLELLEERMKGSEAAQLAAALEATQAEAAQAAEALEAAKQKQKEMRELAKVCRAWAWCKEHTCRSGTRL